MVMNNISMGKFACDKPAQANFIVTINFPLKW